MPGVSPFAKPPTGSVPTGSSAAPSTGAAPSLKPPTGTVPAAPATVDRATGRIPLPSTAAAPALKPPTGSVPVSPSPLTKATGEIRLPSALPAPAAATPPTLAPAVPPVSQPPRPSRRPSSKSRLPLLPFRPTRLHPRLRSSLLQVRKRWNPADDSSPAFRSSRCRCRRRCRDRRRSRYRSPLGQEEIRHDGCSPPCLSFDHVNRIPDNYLG